MSTKRILLTILAASAVLAAVGIGPQFIGSARALPPAQAGVTIPYSGRLSNQAGGPVADGAYDFTFALYAAQTGGEPVWTETHKGVAVQGGAFTVLLGRAAPLPQEVLDGGARWLEVGVRGPGEAEYTRLSPRQELSAAAPAAQVGAIAPAGGGGLSCAHTHWGETWSGSGPNYGLTLYSNSDTYAALRASDTSPNGGFGVFADSYHGTGVYGYASAATGETYGVYGQSASTFGRGVYGRSDGAFGRGVYGYAAATSGTNYGVYGQSNSPDGVGVYGYASATSGPNLGVYGRSNSPDGYGVYAYNSSGIGIYASGGGSARDRATIRAINTNTNHGMAAYLENNSDYATAHFYNGSTGEVLYLQNGGTDASGSNGGYFIRALNEPESDVQFSVSTSGEVRSDVGFNTPASDFAEMLPAVEGLEPGDVLVIGVDGKLARSTQAYQATVVGIYSTQPGFVGGQPVEEELEGYIPLAVVGVVPVKASAENGPIRPGDLLVASSTPGHAMKAGANPAVGTVIGKTLEGLESGTGVIRMLVMLQ